MGWTSWKMREDQASTIELGMPDKLAGLIVDAAGEPIVNAQVFASLSRTRKTPDGNEAQEWLGGIAPLQELGTQTDKLGRFVLNNLPRNHGVDLLVTASGKATTYSYQSKRSRPAFMVGQTDVEMVLYPEARIKGQIVNSDTGQGMAYGKFAVVATFSSPFYYRFVVSVADNGTFALGGLQTGRYLVPQVQNVGVRQIAGPVRTAQLLGECGRDHRQFGGR